MTFTDKEGDALLAGVRSVNKSLQSLKASMEEIREQLAGAAANYAELLHEVNRLKQEVNRN